MSRGILKSKATAWAAFALVVVFLVCTFRMRTQWWAFTNVFFLFLMAFSHAVALTIEPLNARASRKLDFAALVCAVLAVVALAVEAIIMA